MKYFRESWNWYFSTSHAKDDTEGQKSNWSLKTLTKLHSLVPKEENASYSIWFCLVFVSLTNFMLSVLRPFMVRRQEPCSNLLKQIYWWAWKVQEQIMVIIVFTAPGTSSSSCPSIYPLISHNEPTEVDFVILILLIREVSHTHRHKPSSNSNNK